MPEKVGARPTYFFFFILQVDLSGRYPPWEKENLQNCKNVIKSLSWEPFNRNDIGIPLKI